MTRACPWRQALLIVTRQRPRKRYLRIDIQFTGSELRIARCTAQCQKSDRALVACDYLLAPADLFAMRLPLTLSHGVWLYGIFGCF